MRSRTSLLPAALAAALASPALAQVFNGGFETGDFSGWAYTGNSGSAVVEFELARDTLLAGQQPPLNGLWEPTEGAYFASLWTTDSLGSNEASLSRVIPGEAGGELRFNYFFDFGDVAPNFDWARAVVSWSGGQEVLFEHNTSPLNRLGDDANIDWTPVVFTFPVSGPFTLAFRVGDESGDFESILGIDAVVPAVGAPVVVLAGALAALRRAGRR